MENWLDVLRNTAKEIREFLPSQTEFNRLVQQILDHPLCPFQALDCAIERRAPFKGLVLGKSHIGDPSEVRTIDPLDGFGAKCRIRIWSKTSQDQDFSVATAIDEVASLVTAYWKPDLRDSVSWLLSKQNSEREHLLEKTILRLARTGVSALFYLDLDNFGAANNVLGHLEGDRVIREFGSVLEDRIAPNGIVIHRSGDEFLVLHSVAGETQALELAHLVMQNTAAHDFKTGAVQIGVKTGIVVFSKNSPSIGSDALETLAERAVVPSADRKQRGVARLALSQVPEPAPERTSEGGLQMAIALLRSAITSDCPFANRWLSFISAHAYKSHSNDTLGTLSFDEALGGILKWIKPELLSSVLTAARDPDETLVSPRFSMCDVAFALAHATFRIGLSLNQKEVADKRVELHLSVDSSAGSLWIEPDHRAVFSWGNAPTEQKLDLGCFVRLEGSPDAHLGTRALLVKIGHSPLTIPRRLFSDVLVVDDRPTRGGGLPDFWEASVARLTGIAESNPNLSAVFVLGEQQYGAETISRLRGMEKWSLEIDRLSYKTGMSPESLRDTAERLRAKVFLPRNVEELIGQLLSVLRTAAILQPKRSQPALGQRFLQRELIKQRSALSVEDGCRVADVATAFPLVLEIARKAKGEEFIRDQAGQQLRELTDFRVQLTAPSSNMVPAFYRDDEASLNRYFEREFLDQEKGLFGKPFSETKQLKAVIDHISFVIGDSKNQFSSRRAILVVPHVIETGQELTPLGLVSVRLIPRFVAGRRIIHYSFTWRTVEVLVGFPYSLYGSVRFAQHLTDRIRENISPDYGKTVEMGEVSYIAHSLHMFLDDFGQTIARRIVEDASV